MACEVAKDMGLVLRLIGIAPIARSHLPRAALHRLLPACNASNVLRFPSGVFGPVLNPPWFRQRKLRGKSSTRTHGLPLFLVRAPHLFFPLTQRLLGGMV